MFKRRKDHTHIQAEVKSKDLTTLSHNERLVIESIYIMDPPMTFTKIAKLIGVKRQMISQLRNTALRKVRGADRFHNLKQLAREAGLV